MTQFGHKQQITSKLFFAALDWKRTSLLLSHNHSAFLCLIAKYIADLRGTGNTGLIKQSGLLAIPAIQQDEAVVVFVI